MRSILWAMSTKTLAVGAGALVGLALVFIFTDLTFFLMPGPERAAVPSAYTPPPTDLELVVEHSVSGGVHTYTGGKSVPACHTVGGGLAAVGVDPAYLTLTL